LLNDKNKQIDSLNTQISTLTIVISSLNIQISELNSTVSNLQNQITSQNSTISLLTSNLTNLQNQVMIQQEVLNVLLDGTATLVTVDDIAYDPTVDPSALLNKTVMVEGRLSDLVCFFPEYMPPYDYKLYRLNETSEHPTVFAGLSWNSSNPLGFTNVLVIGVVRFVISGAFTMGGYFIEVEGIFPLK